MKNKIFKISILIFLFSLLFQSFVLAQEKIETLPEVSIAKIIKRLGDVLFYLTLLLSFLFVVAGGLMFSLSGGDPRKAEDAKRLILYALIGLLIGASAYGIVNLIYGVIK
jgi:uncharacterized phage infection (PIP) family protein YhgE